MILCTFSNLLVQCVKTNCKTNVSFTLGLRKSFCKAYYKKELIVLFDQSLFLNHIDVISFSQFCNRSCIVDSVAYLSP